MSVARNAMRLPLRSAIDTPFVSLARGVPVLAQRYPFRERP
jgi:hypothetical protein